MGQRLLSLPKNKKGLGHENQNNSGGVSEKTYKKTNNFYPSCVV